LDPQAVERFLQTTHDAYARHLRRCFGPHMPGIFTDEPNYSEATASARRGGCGAGLPFNPAMVADFKRQSGMDLIQHLPELFFEGPRSPVRFAYFRCLMLRFLKAFTIPYARRCRQYGLLMTGHFLAEDDLMAQLGSIGAAMPHYWFMHAPGVDHLRRRHDHLLTHRQCSSVAAQAGRGRVLSELFGVSGQDMSFEDQKWIGDYHLVNGINLFCPHLMLYTMTGPRKRDYPPTFSYHQPYWPHLRFINDYFARAAWLLSQGKCVADILLLHPIGSAWASFQPPLNDRRGVIGPRRTADRLSKSFEAILASLVQDHRDVHLGDEYLLERFARVRGSQLLCGKMSYDLLIVPPSLTWRPTTLALLEQFLQAGGRVVFVKPTPSRIDGRREPRRWRRLLAAPRAMTVTAGRLRATLQRLQPRRVWLQDDRGRQIAQLRHAIRRDGSRQIFFFCNTSRQRSYRATIRLRGLGRVERWDPATGSVETVPARRIDGCMVLQHDFAPVGSLVLVLDASARPVAGRGPVRPARAQRILRLTGPWRFRRQQPNSMTLDYCRYRLGSGRWSAVVPTWQARQAVHRAAGIEPYLGIQPWALARRQIHPRPVQLALRFEFTSQLKQPDLALVVERIEQFKLRVNGTPVRPEPGQWHWDRQFGKVRIGKLIRRGRNTIELAGRYCLEMEIEEIYLVGDFATQPTADERFALSAEPDHLDDGDWCPQGYHFYTGNMTYLKQVSLRPRAHQRVYLRLRRPSGCGFVVRVNDQDVGTLGWQPWQVELTNALRPGRNELAIDVLGTLRNGFGPLHHRHRQANFWWGPQSFSDPQYWTDQYQFVPYGLIGGAELLFVHR
ncbi:MAG: hypothetical protein ACE5K7_01990, partial [Phycisphaerae bacterium]